MDVFKAVPGKRSLLPSCTETGWRRAAYRDVLVAVPGKTHLSDSCTETRKLL